MRTTLFIYGTLKRGQINHHLIAEEQFIREARTQADYRLFNLGWYPGMVAVPEGGVSVHGELWEVSDACRTQLDTYEGDEYVLADVLLDNGDSVSSYLLRQPDWAKPDAGVVW